VIDVFAMTETAEESVPEEFLGAVD